MAQHTTGVRYPFIIEAELHARSQVERAAAMFWNEVLGRPPAIGRVFSLDDERVPGGHPVVVLSPCILDKAFWWMKHPHKKSAYQQRRDDRCGVAREGLGAQVGNPAMFLCR